MSSSSRPVRSSSRPIRSKSSMEQEFPLTFCFLPLAIMISIARVLREVRNQRMERRDRREKCDARRMRGASIMLCLLPFLQAQSDQRVRLHSPECAPQPPLQSQGLLSF
jgi:hypothetical protein